MNIIITTTNTKQVYLFDYFENLSFISLSLPRCVCVSVCVCFLLMFVIKIVSLARNFHTIQIQFSRLSCVFLNVALFQFDMNRSYDELLWQSLSNLTSIAIWTRLIFIIFSFLKFSILWICLKWWKSTHKKQHRK